MFVHRTFAVPVIVSSACFAAVACDTVPPPKHAPVPTAQPTPAAPPVPAVPTAAATAAPGAASAVAAPPIEPSDAPVEPVAAGPSACPAGMVLVEGDYCSEVEHRCLLDWYAPQNKKVVCEQFEPKATCVGTRARKRYCIDKYEWPNRKGVRPEVMNTFYQAQVKCAAAGKRMCTESEWNFACEGPQMKPFPYGFVRDPKKCNGDHEWDSPAMKKVAARDGQELARLWKGVPSGSQPDCVSDFGVADMPANADEVVAGEGRAKFAAVNTGGPWYSGVRNQCRPKVYTHAEDFYYYFLSFRCCAEPDGKPNETLTYKQINDGTSWANIERLAGFTTDQMKQVLALKDKGECNCAGNSLPGLSLKGPSYLCKTMCGTLLGPGAKDGDDSTRVPHKTRTKIH
jgi:hypothetical protein